MKVALDVSAVPQRPGGAGRYIQEIARRLPGVGVATSLITRRGDTSRWKEISPQANLRDVIPRARVARLAYEAVVVGAGASARGVDLWHSPHYTMPRRRVVPTVVTIHDLTYFTNPEWHQRAKVAVFRRAITYAAHHADVVISVSDASAALLDEFIPDHVGVVVAPLGVELERFALDATNDEAIFGSHAVRRDVPYILFVGTNEPRKGLDTLLDAFERVAHDDPTVELWIAGQWGWGTDPLRTRSSNDAMMSRVRRLGYVDDELLPALVRHARVVAYPSRGEGFGLPVLEAMACGATVVTTRDTVMAEVAGGAATLVEAGNPGELALALVDALRLGDDERTQRARRARARAEQFTWERCVERHVLAYERALGD